MSAAQKYASHAVEDLYQGGAGLPDNFIGTVTAIQFNKNPPHENYKFDGDPIFAHVAYVIEGTTPVEERTVPECYTLGGSSGTSFTVSQDGYGLIPISEESVLRKDCKWATVLQAFAAEGLPKPILQAGDFSKLIGLKGSFKRIADTERAFTAARVTPTGKKRFPPSTLVCIKIIALPGASVTTPGASTAAASSAPAGDIDTRAGQYLAAVVKAKGGKLQRSQILLLVAKVAGDAGDSDKQAVAKRAAEEAFLVGISEAGGVVDAAGDVVAINYNPAVKPQMVTIG